jgi:hypothetical protein
MPWTYTYADGRFGGSHLNSDRMLQMMQDGGHRRANDVEPEIAAQVAKGWPEEATRKFIEALCNGGVTKAAAEQILLERDQPTDATGWVWVENNVKARHFRNVWQVVDGAIEVDMPNARGEHMNTIRNARNKELAGLDIDFMKAIEAADTDAQATIKTNKQTLRDIPQTFDLSTDNNTPEELLTKWPSELPARE